MASIYIHVPYCKTRCIYCDFFTQTNFNSKSDYVSALLQEIALRKNFFSGDTVNTIYFGGGTPSLLSISDIESILSAVYECFTVGEKAEITLEANPDDISRKYLNDLKKRLFTRLSIGVQSFHDQELSFLNRRHSASAAIEVIGTAQNIGFDNISIDLIYGLPGQSLAVWMKNLEQAIALDIQHISSYHLIYEEGTKLYQLLSSKRVAEVDESVSNEMFQMLIQRLSLAGFEHYEISNFAKNGKYSMHNTSYWKGDKYLGLGPAAHSYDGQNRYFNVPSISKYLNGVKTGKMEYEVENLDVYQRYNEFILTGLRTKWGIDLVDLEAKFGNKYLNYCLPILDKYISSQHVKKEGNTAFLSSAGIFISDSIMSDLMWID